MLMTNETIVSLYREAVDNGDPKEIINSLAKTNRCTPGEIRQILNESGEFVPRQKPGPKPKATVIDKSGNAEKLEKQFSDFGNIEESKRVENMSAQTGDEAAAGTKTLEEQGWTEVVLPIPDAVKEVIMKGLDDIEAEIRKKQNELSILEAKYKTVSDYIKR